jgi:hypothetical protein
MLCAVTAVIQLREARRREAAEKRMVGGFSLSYRCADVLKRVSQLE